MSLSTRELLVHIDKEIDYLLRQSEGLSYSQFVENETLLRAFTRSLEIIGEAAKKVPKDVQSKYTEIEWKAMAGMRDKLIHDYFGIDFEINPDQNSCIEGAEQQNRF